MKKKNKDPRIIAYQYASEIIKIIKEHPELKEYVEEYLDSVSFHQSSQDPKQDFFKEENIVMYDDLLSHLNRKISETYSEISDNRLNR